MKRWRFWIGVAIGVGAGFALTPSVQHGLYALGLGMAAGWVIAFVFSKPPAKLPPRNDTDTH